MIAAVVAVSVAVRAFPQAASVARWPLPGVKTVFVVSLAIYLFLGMRSLRAIGIGGDEPHYLVITQSLLADRDLKIENNHRQRDYRAFYGGDIRPDFIQRGIDGEIYSIHAPGLPVILLPAYAVGGVRGAIAMLCVLAALGAVAIFKVGTQIGGAGGRMAHLGGLVPDGAVHPARVGDLPGDGRRADHRLDGCMAGVDRRRAVPPGGCRADSRWPCSHGCTRSSSCSLRQRWSR